MIQEVDRMVYRLAYRMALFDCEPGEAGPYVARPWGRSQTGVREPRYS
jgi:hypothetical protein